MARNALGPLTQIVERMFEEKVASETSKTTRLYFSSGLPQERAPCRSVIPGNGLAQRVLAEWDRLPRRDVTAALVTALPRPTGFPAVVRSVALHLTPELPSLIPKIFRDLTAATLY